MIYRFMRTLILEKATEITYYVPFSRSFNVLMDGFSTKEIDDVQRLLSGDSPKNSDLYSTEITFDRDKLVSLLSTGKKDLGSAVDSVEIRTNIETDPVTEDVAEIISTKINNQISLRRKAESSDKEQKDAVLSEPSEIGKLSVSQRLVDMIKGFEGFRAYPYTCPGGSLTIGYGTTIKPGEYTSITKEQGEALLRKSISGFERSVKNLVKVPLNQNQYDALVSFTYNVGAGALKRSTLLKKLNSGDYSGAADELLKFTKANGKVLEGLVRRREKERNLFLA
jgi:lysozyme